jgi:hypothetical protein
MEQIMNRPYVSLKIVSKESGLIKGVATRKIRRIYHQLQAVKNSEINKICIRVNYDIITDHRNKKVRAINEGEYKTKEEAWYALQCFTEK